MLFKKKFDCQLVFVEFLIFLFTILVFLFVNKGIFFSKGYIDNKNSTISYSLLFIFIVIGITMSFYCDYKYNNLKFKNIFLYLGVGVALIGIINSLSLPTVVSLPNNSTMTITGSQRAYGVFSSIMLGLLPYLFFYAVPRKLRFKKYIEFVLFIFIFVVLLSFILSLFLDFESYITTIKSGFSDLNHPIKSFYPHKNTYARILFIGVCSVIYIDIYTNKHLWLIMLIPFTISLLFTIAKMPIVLGLVAIAFYLIYKLIIYIKNNKDNLFIFFLILGFVVCISTVLFIFAGFSQTGIMFKIKNIFIQIGESAKNTFSSRMIIWDCTLKLLKPIQYIFGFSYTLVGSAIHIVYSNDARCHEETTHIWTSHNSLLQMIAEGGVVYLIINLFFLASIIYASIKIYKNNKHLTIMNVLVVVLILIQGITDSIMIFGEGDNVFFTALISLPIFGEYYMLCDKDEIKNRNEIVKNANLIKKIVFKSKLLDISKKLLIIKANYIKRDINNLTKTK